MKIFRTLLIISTLFQPTITKSQIDFDTQYQISVKAIDAIRANSFEEFSKLINEEILKDSDLKTFKEFIRAASEIVNKYDTIAPKDLLLLGISKTSYKNKPIEILSLSFQFPPPRKQTMTSDQNLMFLFSEDIDENKLVGFKIQDFTAHEKLMAEKAKNIPHLKSFNLDIDDLDWFRIWYDKGPTNNSFGNNEGVYALSGKKKILKKAKIEDLFNEILELINIAPIDSIDINTKLGGQTIGNSEYLYLRMKFKNLAYKDLNEFTATAILNEGKDIKEINKKYLIIRHSRSHRYLINLDKQDLLKEKLKTLAHINHGKLLEKNP